MHPVRRKVGRHRLTPGVLTLVVGVWASTDAFAQDFDPSTLAPGDIALIQEMLENERSHVRRSLPVSDQVISIVRTETQPRICRHFVLQSLTGDQQRGVGCRIGAGQWQLAAAIGTIAQAPVPIPPATDNAVTPRVTTVLRPVEAEQDEPAPAPIVSSPAAWTGVPLPGRRPTAETGQTPGAQAASDDTEAGPETAPAAVPAELATVPLPAPRPTGPSTRAIAVAETVADAPTPDGAEPDIADVPRPALIETEGLTFGEAGPPAEVAQGDTDISQDRSAAVRDDAPPPIEPPVPGNRP